MRKTGPFTSPVRKAASQECERFVAEHIGHLTRAQIALDAPLRLRCRFRRSTHGGQAVRFQVPAGSNQRAEVALSPGTLPVPESPANRTFGAADRRTLFITARKTLYQVRIPIPGLP